MYDVFSDTCLQLEVSNGPGRAGTGTTGHVNVWHGTGTEMSRAKGTDTGHGTTNTELLLYC